MVIMAQSAAKTDVICFVFISFCSLHLSRFCQVFGVIWCAVTGCSVTLCVYQCCCFCGCVFVCAVFDDWYVCAVLKNERVMSSTDNYTTTHTHTKSFCG